METLKRGKAMYGKILSITVFGLFLISCAANGPSSVPQTAGLMVKVQAAETEQIETNEGEFITKSMVVPNEEGRLSELSFISKDKAFVKIFSDLSVSDVTRLWNDIVVLELNSNIRDINLFINSPGGDAFSGLALADQIERAQRKGFRVTAHASGIVASAAVPVFAVCKVRLAAPGTIFMVHEAELWKWPGRETASDISSQNELMSLLRDRYLAKLVTNSRVTKEKWEQLEHKTTWFSAEKALEWGLVDKIE
jgi:ATP-dependent protease ClpP protease subunit